MNIVDVGMLTAIESHAGDRNKHDGEMYILHLARVWINVRDAGGGELEQTVAWLHDVPEDTSLKSPDDLRTKLHLACLKGGVVATDDMIQTIVRAVFVLKKTKGEPNEDYYHKVRADPVARFVKLNGDIVDNFRRNHQITDEATRLRMAHKYSMGMDILQ